MKTNLKQPKRPLDQFVVVKIDATKQKQVKGGDDIVTDDVKDI